MTVLRRIIIIILGLVVTACGSTSRNFETAVPDPVYKVGKPYKVAGKTYYPKVDTHYDRVGLASWYGHKFHGRKTANGDIFNMNDLTAAHTTLPMPSYVRVTNVENGRWLILKINDRGPFVGNRLIDVSRRAAQLLGFEKKGVTRVRIQAVTGPRGELPRQIQAKNTPPPERKPPQIQLARNDIAQNDIYSQKPAVSPDHSQNDKPEKIYVQIGAYANLRNAEKVVDTIPHIRDTKVEKVDINGRNLYRVRIGPHPTVELAEILLGRILSLGHNTARIIMDK